MALFGLLKPDPLKQAAVAIYGVAGGHARDPWFFTEGAVADTFDGRFDLLVLHLHLCIRRQRASTSRAKEAQQFLFDTFMKDMDQGLRLQGVGDIGVGHRVKKMTHAYYGRAVAYDEAMDAGDAEALLQALHRNLYRLAEVPEDVLDAMTNYVFIQAASLSDLSEERFHAGDFAFGLPELTGAGE